MVNDNNGIKVEVLIVERNMSLRELAHLSGIEPSNLNNFTNGNRKFT